MIKKLTKGIEDAKKEKELLQKERGNMDSTFKEIEQKAFAVQENYKKTQKVSSEFKNFTKLFVMMTDIYLSWLIYTVSLLAH